MAKPPGLWRTSHEEIAPRNIRSYRGQVRPQAVAASGRGNSTNVWNRAMTPRIVNTFAPAIRLLLIALSLSQTWQMPLPRTYVHFCWAMGKFRPYHLLRPKLRIGKIVRQALIRCSRFLEFDHHAVKCSTSDMRRIAWPRGVVQELRESEFEIVNTTSCRISTTRAWK
jgi:hypothetical protein